MRKLLNKDKLMARKAAYDEKSANKAAANNSFDGMLFDRRSFDLFPLENLTHKIIEVKIKPRAFASGALSKTRVGDVFIRESSYDELKADRDVFTLRMVTRWATSDLEFLEGLSNIGACRTC